MAKVMVIVGASPRRDRFSNKSIRAHLKAGYRVIPVHPTEKEIEGLRAYPDLASVPGPIDCISLYVNPAVTASLLPEIARCGAQTVWFNPGTADTDVLEAARRMGIPLIDGCSIVALGMSPSQFSDQ